MKISFLSAFPPYRGGISKHSSLIYSHLSKKHDVQAINFSKLYPNIFFPGKSQYDYNLENIGERCLNSMNFFTWFKPVSVIQKNNPDILLFKFWHPFFVPIYNFIINRIKKRCDVHIIMICDNIFPHENFPFQKKLIKKIIKNVDGFLVQSSIVEKELKSLLAEPVYVKRFHPIYDDYPKKINKIDARKILGIKESKVVLFFGFIRKYKGLDILIKSMEKVFEKDPDVKLLIAGECYDNKNIYHNLINKSRYKDNIVWIDEFISDSDISKYFSASDVVVLPYRSASQSGVIPLAYHYNRPVITSNIQSLIEVVEQGSTGYIFERCDIDDLVFKILNFFDSYNYEFYNDKIEKYKINFSWNFFISGIENIYDKLNEKR